MPFVTDIYPPSKGIEAVAGLGLAVGARRSRGFPGRRQHEDIEVLGRFNLLLRTEAWEKGEESCSGLIIDPHGLLTGSVNFDLTTGGPQADVKDNMGEEDFIVFCQQLTRAATEFLSETVEVRGLIAEPEQVQAFLIEEMRDSIDTGMERVVDSEKITGELRQRMYDYGAAAEAWSLLRQKTYAFRDQQVFKINEAAHDAKTASNKTLEELNLQVKSTIASKRQEIDAAREDARLEHKKKKELYQSELERFHRQFKEEGDDYWREKIKIEEQGLAENDRKLEKMLEQLNDIEKKFAQSQQEKVALFKAEREKRFAAFDQRLKRLDTVLAGLEKAVDKRLECYREQQNKILGLLVSLTAEQCGKEFPVVFFAARYSGPRWQVFPPQLFGGRGIKGKFAGLMGDPNLPFRPAGKVAEELAEKLQSILPGHVLGARLEEQNLLNDSSFIREANAGLAELVDRGEVSRKYTNLFDGF